MRPAVPVVLAFLLASCTSGTADRSGSGSPTPSATQAPTSTERSLVLAVRREKHPGLWLYRVDRSRMATLVRSFVPPDGDGRPSWTSLSQGTSPVLCTVWERDDRDDDPIWCYPWGGPGAALPSEGDGYTVAVRPDAKAVAWQSAVHPRDAARSRYELVVAPFGVGTGDRQAFVSQSQELPAGSRPLCAENAGAMTWVADDSVLVQEWGANDFPGELYLLPVSKGPAGSEPDCVDVPEPTHQAQDGFNYYTSPASFDATSFVAVEGQYCEIECADRQPPLSDRAVRVDLSTGRVLEVVATPAQGRAVTSVSGGTHGIAYVTWGSGRQRVYLRWPGERHGTPITGLPEDVESIVAQP